MVRSSSSCLRIITCGGSDHKDYVEDYDLRWSKSKASAEKQWWSFGKRSERHEGLGNSKIKESLPTENAENQDFAATNFHSQSNLTVTYPPRTEEKALNFKIDPFISMGSVSKPFPLHTLKIGENVDSSLEECLVIEIQAAIRAYSAQIAFSKLKNVIKLQAVIRGHLVRRQAVESLRCVQAIIKMQALVRACHARMASEVLGTRSKFAGREGLRDNTVKLINNGFSHQLLELTPKRTQIFMKCDLSKPDSAWQWLERWSSASLTNILRPWKPQYISQSEEQVKRTDTIASDQVTEEIPDDLMLASIDMRSSFEQLEDEASLNKFDAESYDFEFCFPMISFSATNELQHTRLEGVGLSIVQEKSSEVETNQTGLQLENTYETTFSSTSHKKNPMFASRESCSPAFLAVQSKIEELTSTATSSRSTILMNQDIAQEFNINRFSPSTDPLMRSRELGPTENLITSDPIIEVGGSECGTELSISSTLDSPDQPEVGVVYFGNESTEMEIINGDDSIGDISNFGVLDLEVKRSPFTSQQLKSCLDHFEGGKLGIVNGDLESLGIINGALESEVPKQHSPVEHSADKNARIQMDTIIDQQVHRLSTEGSPGSHVTTPESCTTTSSKTPSKAHRKQLKKSETVQNSKQQHVRRRLLSKNLESGGRHSLDQPRKEQNNGNRRISFGSAKSDHTEQEQRDRSRSASLPSYMQATESAKAKAHTNNSSRSSPDAQATNTYAQKLPSLPSTSGKQGSPGTQPSTPQSKHRPKGHHTREKWQS